MIITDKLFGAFLKCQTKHGCREMLTAADTGACFIGTPTAYDFTQGHYP
jgi:hypothetical protein